MFLNYLDNQYRSVLVNQWLGKINFFYWTIIVLLTNCLPILWPPDAKSQFIGKIDAGKRLKAKGEGGGRG